MALAHEVVAAVTGRVLHFRRARRPSPPGDPPCLPLILARPGGEAAIERASRHCGAYLDRLRQTDMGQLTVEQWDELLAIAIACGEEPLPWP